MASPARSPCRRAISIALVRTTVPRSRWPLKSSARASPLSNPTRRLQSASPIAAVGLLEQLGGALSCMLGRQQASS